MWGLFSVEHGDQVESNLHVALSTLFLLDATRWRCVRNLLFQFECMMLPRECQVPTLRRLYLYIS